MNMPARWCDRFRSLFGGPAPVSGAGTPLDLDVLPLAAVRLDGAGRITQANAGWTQLIAQPGTAHLGRDYRSVLHPEDRARWETLWNARRSGLVPAGEKILRHLSKDGGLRWAETRLAVDAAGVFALLVDVTEQRREQRALQASHRSLTRLLDDLPMMIYRCRNNRLWSMEYVSAGCFDLTGYRAEQLIDSCEFSYNALIHPDDREFVWAQVQAALSEMRPFTLNYRLLRADAQECRVQERGCGIYADGGEVLGLEGVVLARSLP